MLRYFRALIPQQSSGDRFAQANVSRFLIKGERSLYVVVMTVTLYCLNYSTARTAWPRWTTTSVQVIIHTGLCHNGDALYLFMRDSSPEPQQLAAI